jgi:hypothetical protein
MLLRVGAGDVFNVNATLFVTPASVALKLAVRALVIVPAVVVNDVEEAPVGIVTVAGTGNRIDVLVTLTTVGETAAPLNVTWQVDDRSDVNVVGAQPIPLRTGAGGVVA